MPEPAAEPGWPAVGVIMPILNEERHVEEAVAAVLGRTTQDRSSLCSRWGPASDRTDEIAARIAAHEPMVSIVAKPHRQDT